MRIVDLLCGRTAVAALGLLATLASPASATATLVCDIKDANVTFELVATTGRSEGGIVGVVGGSLKPKGAKAELPVTMENIAQQWTFEKELRVAIRIDQEGDAPNYHLAILTKGVGDDGAYVGRYVLTVEGGGKTQKFKGKVKNCQEG